MRRHRGDLSYLEWALRCASASAALAVCLLGLGANVASAQATFFRTGLTQDPILGVDLGSGSSVAMGDLDADGDPDFVASQSAPDGTIHYFENTGNALLAAVVERNGSANPFDGLDAGNTPHLALGDIDRDGDLDLVSGEDAGVPLRFFENTGTPTSPGFVERTGGFNPFDGIHAPHSAPALGDLDVDGDLDLVVGESAGDLRYFENAGDPQAPVFVERTGGSNPWNGVDIGSKSVPALGDLDGDGDLDLLAGEYSLLTYFENTGSPRAAAFAQRTGLDNPCAETVPGMPSSPALADLDGDGDLDLMLGLDYGSFAFRENRSGNLHWHAGTFPFPPFAMSTPGRSAPSLGDLDDDGDLDMITGSVSGDFSYVQNFGDRDMPSLAGVSGSGNPLDGQDVGSWSSPTLGDLDADGDLDLVSGEYDGLLNYYQNTGSPSVPHFAPRAGSANPLDGYDLGQTAYPALGDLDGDGDLDLVAGTVSISPQQFRYFENSGSPTTPAFIERIGSANPLPTRAGDFAGIPPGLGDIDGDGDLDLIWPEFPANRFVYAENTGTRTVPAFTTPKLLLVVTSGSLLGPTTLGDLDGDGDADVFSGSDSGNLRFFENAIVRPAPRFEGPNAIPLAGVDVGFFSTAAAADLDADGDPDFAVSASFGTGAIQYFENTGDAVLPQVVERTGSASPFQSLNAGGTPQLAFGDIDADGDFDLISGENYGAPLRFFENTGDPLDPAFVQRVGSANPFDGVNPDRAAPTLGDLNLDGDLDLVVGEFPGTFRYYENTGDAESATYVQRSGGTNPLNGFDVGSFSTAALGDVDRDGDLDLIAGDEPNGVFAYFENTGNATTPAFIARNGSANPLDGEDVGLNSTPTFVDLDHDGDLDVVSGERYGTFATYYLPEPGLASLLAAGSGLLAWLARWRGRSRR